ncbi:hypothetical protein PCASD_23784 [Puccinia coronata f. sp. avenae]|uniref:Phosphatidyl-N-methylethanolamine N-methyltransferase n=1 Tax=Puccinia coronata f. sp. avenae TaxID=200324 RepID=A0A2N5TRP1_9BASI|nr:hypothetical protein PCASD_23784 [Puccinia coronata f. sp. avenae]
MSPSTIAQFKPTLEDACNLIITQKRGNCLPICVSLPADLLTPVAAYLKLTNGAQCQLEISSSASDQTVEGVKSFLLESVVAGSHHTHYSFFGSKHSTHFLTRLAGSAHRGCYLIGATIFVIGIIRDHFYKQALEYQPTHATLNQPIIQSFAKASFALGYVLVMTSMWSLGFTGTYLSDYFGILMDHMVQGFPFNCTLSPMDNGSTLCFLGTALSYQSPAWVILTGLVYLVYQVALKYEELSQDLLPFKNEATPY